jgi:non-ribosomal peptide synthetase component F
MVAEDIDTTADAPGSGMHEFMGRDMIAMGLGAIGDCNGVDPPAPAQRRQSACGANKCTIILTKRMGVPPAEPTCLDPAAPQDAQGSAGLGLAGDSYPRCSGWMRPSAVGEIDDAPEPPG